MSYHVAKIQKGILGEVSKIVEECQEVEDAYTQENAILVLCELADLYGAIDAYLRLHHPSVDMNDLDMMAAATARAFKTGAR